MDTCSPWHPDTHRSERPEVQPEWATPLQHGDLQIVFAVQRYGGYRLSTESEGDPRFRYFITVWNEGYWHPVAQPAADFDLACHLKGNHERTTVQVGTRFFSANPIKRLFSTQHRTGLLYAFYAGLPISFKVYSKPKTIETGTATCR